MHTHQNSILDSPSLHPGLAMTPSWTTITSSWTYQFSILGSPMTLSWIHQDSIWIHPRLHLGLTKTPCLIHQWMNTPHNVVHWRLLKLRLHGWLHNFSWSLSGFPLVELCMRQAELRHCTHQSSILGSSSLIQTCLMHAKKNQD